MNLYGVLVWVGAAVVVFVSLLMIITKRPMWVDSNKYTYTSLEKFSRIAGLIGMIIGISAGIVLYYLSCGQVNTLSMISLVVLCVAYAGYFYSKKKILVKKGTKTKKKKKK